MEMLANRFGIMSTYLIYHIDKGLRVVPKEATNRVAIIFTREDRLNQGRELMRVECASDQTCTG